MNIVTALFLILHGLVHLLYFGQSQGFFKLKDDLNWPQNSWFFGRLLDEKAHRRIAGFLLIFTTLVFVTAGILIFASQPAWKPITAVAAGISTVLLLVFWDGKLTKLPDKGLFAILINVAILILIFGVGWPDFGF